MGTAASSPLYHAAPLAADPLVFWADIYLAGFWVVAPFAFILVFVTALRGFLRLWGPSAVLWGFVPAALGGALAAFCGGFLWPLLLLFPLLLIDRRPKYTYIPDGEPFRRSTFSIRSRR